MFWTILILLVGLWSVGKAFSYTMGGFLHLLLVWAALILMVRVVSTLAF